MKRFAAAALCLGLALSLMPVGSLAAPSLNDEVLPVLAVMGVMNGDDKGNLNLDSQVTRAEFVKMAVSASSLKSQGQAPSLLSPYPDVKAGAWHSGYITAARDSGLITGYLDGTFSPNNYVTLEEGVSIMLKAMGYTDADFSAGYPAAHLAIYRSLDMDDGMTAQQGQRLTRRDCAVLIYNALSAKAKSGMIYAVQLGYSVDAQGRINYAALTQSLTQGPVMMGGGSVGDYIGFTPLTVYRDRSLSSLDKIAYGDVLYYIADVRTVWAYSQKISGVVQAISPSTANPTTVTVSGVTCALGSSSVIYAFSDPGTVKTGDRVTLLCGAGGQAVFVMDDEQMSQEVWGVVLSNGTQATADDFGSPIQGNYITVAATDGRTYTYPYSGGIKAGDAVSVRVDGEKVTVTRASSSVSLSGAVKNGKLNGYQLDDDTEILDHLSTRSVTVSPDRLEGVTVSSSDIALCQTTDKHIDRLILKNVTGDVNDYGIMTSVSESQNVMLMPSSYVYLINGVPGFTTANIKCGVKEGPCAVIYNNGQVKSFSSLTGKKIESLSAYSAKLSGVGEMKLSDSVQVYVRDGDDYYLSSRMNVNTDEYDLKGYYDKDASQGGRIRVIVAEEK